jgi:hypothetical protein
MTSIEKRKAQAAAYKTPGELEAEYTAIADGHAAERRSVEAQLNTLDRRFGAIVAEQADLQDEHQRLAVVISDAGVFDTLGLRGGVAVDSNVKTETARLADVEQRMAVLADERAQIAALQVDLRQQIADSEAREAEARRQAQDAPRTLKRAAVERHVKSIRRAYVHYLTTLRDAGELNLRLELPRRPQGPPDPAEVYAIDMDTNDLGLSSLEPGSSRRRQLLRPSVTPPADTRWLDSLIQEVSTG